MKQNFQAILDECWRDIEEGRATIESCVARYPQQAEKLEAFLRLAERLRAIPQPELSASDMAAIEARMLRLAEELRQNRQARPQPEAKLPFFSLLTRAAALALAMVLAVAVLGAGLVFASAHSLPGSPLYGVKRTVEQAQLALTLNQAERSVFHLTLANRRLGEVITLFQTQGELDEPTLLAMLKETELALEEAQKSPEAVALWAVIIDTTERQQVALQELRSSLPENDRQRIDLALAASQRLQARARQAAGIEVTLQTTPLPTPSRTPTLPPSTLAPPTIAGTAPSEPQPTSPPTVIAIVPAPMVTEKPVQPHPEQRYPAAGQLALSFGGEYTEVQDVHAASVNLGLIARADSEDEDHGQSAARLIQAKKAGITSWAGIKKLGGHPAEKGKNPGWVMSGGKGGPPEDKGGPPKDKGGPPEDKGGPPEDKGGPPKDKGGPPKDKGGPPEDKGGPPKDKGGPPEDKGGPPEDKGGPPEDKSDKAGGGGKKDK